MNRTEKKKEIWEIIESYAPKLSDEIGWGSMDSLCGDLIDYYIVDK